MNNMIINVPHAYDLHIPTKEAIGRTLRKLRENHGYSREYVAEFLGFTSDRVIYQHEKGQKMPSTENLWCLAQLYKITLDEIMNAGREPEGSLSHFYTDSSDSHKAA